MSPISTRTVWLPMAASVKVPLALKLPLASVLAALVISQDESLEVPIRRIGALGAAWVNLKSHESPTQYARSSALPASSSLSSSLSMRRK